MAAGGDALPLERFLEFTVPSAPLTQGANGANGVQSAQDDAATAAAALGEPEYSLRTLTCYLNDDGEIRALLGE